MSNLYETILSHGFFRRMKREHLAVLADGAREVKFKAGEVLFREGEPASEFYLVRSGEIALEAHEHGNETILVQTLGAGEVLGWSWLFPPFVWHFQARATEPTEAVSLSGAHLLNVSERDHEFGHALMKRVAQVVIHRLQATRKQLLEQQIQSALEG